MLPSWLTKPEMIFAIVLWFTSPLWFFFTAWLWQRGRSWNASLSERAAQQSITYLKNQMEHPPTLAESLAFIVCFLPLPFFLVFLALTLYIMPAFPLPLPHIQDVHLAHEIVRTSLIFLFFPMYTLFGVLSVHGIQVAFRLRHGAAHYADNYRMGIQKRIDKLKKKFPQL
jgi:hypothetical protein